MNFNVCTQCVNKAVISLPDIKKLNNIIVIFSDFLYFKGNKNIAALHTNTQAFAHPAATYFYISFTV